MACHFYRNRLQESVSTACRRFADASELNHPGLKEKAREVAVSGIIEPLLFDQLQVGSGIIVDYLGSQSNETDCIIFNRRLLPPIMRSRDSGVYPLDAVMVALEIKSRLTASELRDASSKASQLWSLRYSTGGYRPIPGGEPEVEYYTLMPALFAFESDLLLGGKTELDRYREIDPEADERPQLSVFCVVGKGTWLFDRMTKNWTMYPASDGVDEVMDFMAILLDFSATTSLTRPPPKASAYLVAHGGVDATGKVIRLTP